MSDLEQAIQRVITKQHSIAYYIDTDMTGPQRYSAECDCGWKTDDVSEKRRNELASAHLTDGKVASKDD
jgi:hypothetical protein